MTDLGISFKNLNKFEIKELANLLESCDVKISFSGTRYIGLKNSTDSMERIDKIAKKAILLLKKYLQDWNYSLEDRKYISTILEKIDLYYSNTDDLIEKSSFFTQFFSWLKDMFCIFSIRKKWYYIAENLPEMSNYYSESQFKAAFPYNKIPEDPDTTYKNINLFLPPDHINRWYNIKK